MERSDDGFDSDEDGDDDQTTERPTNGKWQ